MRIDLPGNNMNLVRGGTTLNALYKLARKMEMAVSLFEETAPLDMDELPDVVREMLLWRAALLNETVTLFTAIATYYDPRRLTELAADSDFAQVSADLKSVIERGFLFEEQTGQQEARTPEKGRQH